MVNSVLTISPQACNVCQQRLGHHTFAMAMWLSLLAISAVNTDAAQSVAAAVSTGVDDHLLSGAL